MRIVQVLPVEYTGSDFARVVIVDSQGQLLGLGFGKVDGAYLASVRTIKGFKEQFASREYQFPVAALDELFTYLLTLEQIDDLTPLANALLP